MRQIDKSTRMVAFTLLGALLAACSARFDADEAEQHIALQDVPTVVLQSAASAVPGVRLHRAGIEREHGMQIYELEGEVDGTPVEIELTGDGTVLEIEHDR